MKKIIQLFICFILLNSSFTFGQKVFKDFLDGEIYMKIKNEIPFVFDTLHRDIDIRSKLPFLIPLMSRYNITKAESSFYFSRSDALKRIFRIHFRKSELVERLISELKSMNQIEYAEKVPLMRLVYMPNDLKSNQIQGQYGLYNIHAQEAWDVSRGNHSVEVAIVDNAIDINHPDLSANVTNQWDVADDDADPRPPNFKPEWYHGTHTSGIACATSDNGIGIASIGFSCGLMAVKANKDTSWGENVPYGFEGINWAVSNGANVISCSWGTYGFSATGQNIINNAYNNNVVVVAAAGNQNIKTMFYPAAYNHVIAVASVNNLDMKSGFSNYGSWVDVSAPGDSIFSTLPNNGYDFMSGTSMATPFVAGLCGLIRSLNPGLSYDEVVSLVVNSTDNIDAQNPGFIGQLGSGRINAYRAVEAALTCNPSINLGTGVYTVFKTESSGTITSANTIPAGAQVWLDAASTVDILPGFIARNGCVFRAYIDGCGNKLLPDYHSKKQSINSDKIDISKAGNNVSLNAINVFPNPANHKVNIRYQPGNAKSVGLRLYNSNGIAVYETSSAKKLAGTYDITIDVSGFAAGLYLIELKTEDEIKKSKLVIIH